MIDNKKVYASPAAFRRAVGDRLNTAAASRGRPVTELRREFLFQRFLARVFAGEASPWVLKGGVSMLVRLPGGRHSQDVDLLHHRGTFDVLRAVDELRAAAGVDLGDHLTFDLDDPDRQFDGQTVARVRVTGNIELRRFDRFSLDLSTRPHVIGRVERLRPEPVIHVPGLEEPPEFVLYPLADQVADKLCAMYGRYGSADSPSTRYRDLVDLLLIVTSFSLDGASTLRAIHGEGRRRVVQLNRMISPGPQWAVGFNRVATKSSLPAELHALDSALAAVGQCVDPLLTGEVTSGRWDPRVRRWATPGSSEQDEG